MQSQSTYITANWGTSNSPQNTPVFHPDSSGKEKDTETGYHYFGARYYNSDLSLWLSVDPMSDKYPSLSPYNYCAWNPMRIVDPNGDTLIAKDAMSQHDIKSVAGKYQDRISFDEKVYCSS